MHRTLWALALAAVAILGCQSPPPPPVRAVASYVEILAPARQGGPIADYDPVLGVTIHHEVEDMAPELRPALQRWLGGRLIVTGYAAPNLDPDPEEGTALDLSLLWMRDYHPIHIRDAAGRMTLVHYLATNPNRSDFRPPSPEERPGQTWMPTPSGGRWLPSRLMPLVHENGNLLVVGQRVLVSDKLFEDNLEEHDEPHLLKKGYRPRRREEVLRVLAHALDRAPADIVVLPQMPYESTGHVDVFLLPLDEQTVMVPTIEDRALAEVEGRARVVGKVVQVFLDEQALYLESLGLIVPRWPMIPPALAFPVEEGDVERVQEDLRADAVAMRADEEEALARDIEQRGYDGDVEFELLVFSPANALLLNLAPGQAAEGPLKLALLPGFVRAFSDPAMAAMAASYTRKWEKALSRRGWTPQVVDASELVGYLGLFHCVSSPIPR